MPSPSAQAYPFLITQELTLTLHCTPGIVYHLGVHYVNCILILYSAQRTTGQCWCYYALVKLFCMRPISSILAVLLLIQLPAKDGPGKAEQDGPSIWGTTPFWGHRDGNSGSWLQSGLLGSLSPFGE